MSRAVVATNLVDSLAAAGRGKALLERRLAQMAVGIVDAVRAGQMSVDQASEELFNAENYRHLKRRKLSRHTLEMFEWGMELPDVVELAPEGLDESLRRIVALAHRVMSPTSSSRQVRASRRRSPSTPSRPAG
jgi:hypothetical protein